MSERPARLEVRGVSKSFATHAGPVDVVADCTFELVPGAMSVMVGPSGCGKTTLINLIAGYERPSAGAILLDGKGVAGPGSDRLVVFQETALFPWMSVRDNVEFGPLARGEERTGVRTRAEGLLERVGLAEFGGRFPSQLSGGMQRRAELARALVNEPRITLMDEPFRGLDAMTRELMQEHYLRLFEDRPRTSLFVTSELAEALFLGDRLLLMTQRPARVKAVLEIDLPRPRDFRMLTSERFRELYAIALDSLSEEAAKSSGGSTAS